MKALRNVKLFFTFDWKTKLLFTEAFILLGWARVLKCLPFSKVASYLGEQRTETPLHIEESNTKILQNVSRAITIMSRYTSWESMCLVKGIAAMKMLERRQIESTLYLGTAKDESGKLIAHAWLRSGPYYVTGSEGMDRFTVVSKFAKKVNKNSFKGVENG